MREYTSVPREQPGIKRVGVPGRMVVRVTSGKIVGGSGGRMRVAIGHLTIGRGRQEGITESGGQSSRLEVLGSGGRQCQLVVMMVMVVVVHAESSGSHRRLRHVQSFRGELRCQRRRPHHARVRGGR